MSKQITLEHLGYCDLVRDAYLSLLPEQTRAVATGKIEWKLRDHPAGAGEVVIARDEAGLVVGMNVFQSARFQLADGGRILGHQSMDTIVAPAARGCGLFTRMIRHYYEHSQAEVIYGFPNASSSPGFFNKLGWTRFSSVPMLIKPLRTGVLLRRLRMGAIDLSIPDLRSTAEGQDFDRFLDRHERLWRDQQAKVGIAVDRTAPFLDWRFTRNPEIVYQRREIVGSCFAVGSMQEKHDAKIFYLAEAIGQEDDLMRLMNGMTRQAASDGAELAFGWARPDSPGYRAYRKAGFFPFPDRFRPIEINFGARDLRQTRSAPLTDLNWHISYADSDTV